MISDFAFLALSPRLYMITPQPTAQYGQVLRVSVVRASLKLRTSARTGCGEKPIIARLEPVSPAPQTLKNCLRFMSISGTPSGVGFFPRLCMTAQKFLTKITPGGSRKNMNPLSCGTDFRRQYEGDDLLPLSRGARAKQPSPWHRP